MLRGGRRDFDGRREPTPYPLLLSPGKRPTERLWCKRPSRALLLLKWDGRYRERQTKQVSLGRQFQSDKL